jgi:hypothetical protein
VTGQNSPSAASSKPDTPKGARPVCSIAVDAITVPSERTRHSSRGGGSELKPPGRRPNRPNHLDPDHQDTNFHDGSFQSRDRPRHQQLRDGAEGSRHRSDRNCADPPDPGGQPAGREADPGLRAVPAASGGIPAGVVPAALERQRGAADRRAIRPRPWRPGARSPGDVGQILAVQPAHRSEAAHTACLPRRLPRRSIAPRCRRSSSTGSSPGPLSTICRARHGGPDCRNSACPTRPIR